MKKIKVTILGSLASVLLATVSPSAHAESQWIDVTVSRAGYSAADTIGIRLSHDSENPIFVDRWFKARPDIAEGMLSLAVWAMQTDSTLVVQLDPFAPEWSEIDKMYLK